MNEVLDVKITSGVITLNKPFQHKTLEECNAECDGQLVIDTEYDWGESIGMEIWL